MPLAAILQDSEFPFTICRNCIRAFDFSYEWTLSNQDPTEKVKVILENDEGQLLEVELECPQCFFKDVYRLGEITWARSNETKRIEALEAENEALRKRNSRIEKQLSDAKKAKGRLLRDNKKLADSLFELLPESEDQTNDPKQGQRTTHSAYA